MWLLFAIGSAFFAGITSILAKVGIKSTDSSVATAMRTIVVLIFAWLMVFVVGSQSHINDIDSKSLLFLVLSGISTGASWLCYFEAIKLGEINKVVPIDKTSTFITIILAMIFLGEPVSLIIVFAIILMIIGTYFMVAKKGNSKTPTSNKWLIFAVLSSIFASLTAILGKIGIENIESNLGTAIRTGIVLLMAWIVVIATKKVKHLRNIEKKDMFFIALSGISTGASWLCYFRALQEGLASVVVPIDKLSIVFTVAFSFIVFKEKLQKKTLIGLLLLVVGTLLLVL